MSIFGVRIQQSRIPLERTVPNRAHKRRRNQTDGYHRRVQKKWTKRWGVRVERYALMANPQMVGLLGAPVMFVDPRDMVLLRGLRG
jgi:hypothetical protein